MREIELRIIKSPLGADKYSFDYWLSDSIENSQPLFSQKEIHKDRYAEHRQAIIAIQEHINEFISGRAQGGSTRGSVEDLYRKNVEEWVADISDMIRYEFLPDKDSAFAEKMRSYEAIAMGQQEELGNETILKITSNDYLIPWWLCKAFSSENYLDIWSGIFLTGFHPAHKNFTKFKPREKSDVPQIALLSRPTSDLKDIPTLEKVLKDKNQTEALALVQSGMKTKDGDDNNKDRKLGGIGRFGLMRRDIEEVIRDHQVLLYFGHFGIKEQNPGESYLAAMKSYNAGRKISLESDDVSLDSIMKFLRDKVLFLDACRSVGLPSLSEDHFPDDENVLAGYFVA